MKAIVFGGSGFLGSHVADVLTETGFEVTIFDHIKSPYLQPKQKMIVGDILDEKLATEAIKISEHRGAKTLSKDDIREAITALSK